MKKKAITFLLAVFMCFVLAGCGEKNGGVQTKLSCYKDFTLFHSKQHIENKIYLNKDNKLVDYEYSESYFEFDSDNEYTRTCEGLKDEAENNTKIYDYLMQTSNCNSDKQIVTISNKYDLSKVTSKNKLEGKHIKNYLDDDYILDIEKYKKTVADKGYTCK